MAYTSEQEARLIELGTVTYEMAVELGEEFEVSTRSIIAKVQSMDLEYVAKERAPKRPRGMTKSELVARIAESLEADADSLSGLTKATAASLSRVLELTS